jgi:LmbE family N-acetylglucosaminyl deacetylase
MNLALSVLDRWCDQDVRACPRALVFAPHPDDDILGLGAQLFERGARTHVAFVSDGAPENPSFFRELGFATRAAYAETRRTEARAALAIAGVDPSRIHDLNAIDQAVSRDLVAIAQRAAGLVAALEPEVVFAPPYEGGHPDHDATALVVHAALWLLAQSSRPIPVLLEYASYHWGHDRLVFGEFLPHPAAPARERGLPAPALSAKKRMLACHATQRAFLREFPVDREPIRPAPAYDFRHPPAAPFHYDRVDLGVGSAEFLTSADRALSELGIQKPC